MQQLILVIFFVFVSSVHAQTRLSQFGYGNSTLQGTGYWGGQQQQNCMPQMGFGMGLSGAMSGSSGLNQKSAKASNKKTDSTISLLKKEITEKELQRQRAEKEMELAAKKLERYLDSEVLDFILQVHIEKGNTCSDYKTFPEHGCHLNSGTIVNASVDCSGKEDVPTKLQAKWTLPSGGYCTANSKSSAGAVSASICNDVALQNSDRKSLNNSDCGQQLKNYLKFRIQRDEFQAKVERLQDQIEERQLATDDESERSEFVTQQNQKRMESDCEECDLQGRGGGFTSQMPNRDWVSSLTQIGLGLGLSVIGKNYDESNAQYIAQSGYPQQTGYPTAMAMGLPLVMNGIMGTSSGLGAGSQNCGSAMGAGVWQNSAMGMGGGVSQLGMNSSQAFGYPQNIYGQNYYNAYPTSTSTTIYGGR